MQCSLTDIRRLKEQSALKNVPQLGVAVTTIFGSSAMRALTIFLMLFVLPSCGKSKYQLELERDTAEFVKVVKECMDIAAHHVKYLRKMPLPKLCDERSFEIQFKLEHAPYLLNRGTAEIKSELEAIIDDLRNMAVLARTRDREGAPTPRYHEAVEGADKMCDSIESHLTSLRTLLSAYKSN